MARPDYLVAKANRDLRETVRSMPRVEVAVVKPPPKDDRDGNETRTAIVGGSVGTVLTLAGKKAGGAAVNAAGKRVWNSETKRKVVRRLRRT